MCNFPDVQDYFERRNSTPQSVVVLSRQIKVEEVDRYINTKLYRPVVIEREGEKSRFTTIKQQPTLNQYFLEAEKLGGPVLLEFGSHTL